MDYRKKIIKAANKVYKELGSGHSESVYDNAMRVELRHSKPRIKYEGQKVVEVKYKNHYVGEGYLDVVVGSGRDRTIAEFKAITGTMGTSEEQQIRNYMKILKIKKGILINFPQPGKKRNWD